MMSEAQMEEWLRSKGLGRFKDHFMEFGIESIHDLLDADIVSDKELAGEIGMNQAEINKFRKAVDENRICEWDQIPDYVKTRNEEAQKLNSDVFDYALFVRKMKASMYFIRLDHKGKKRRCSVKLCKRHKSFIFSHGTKPIELTFEALRGVTELVDPETGDTKHPKLLEMMTQDEAEVCFLLTFAFEDDEGGDNGGGGSNKKTDDPPAAKGVVKNKAALNTSFAFGGALAKRTIEEEEEAGDQQVDDPDAVRPLNKRRTKQSVSNNSNDSTLDSPAGGGGPGDSDPLLIRNNSGGDGSFKSFKGRHAKEKRKTHAIFSSVALDSQANDDWEEGESAPTPSNIKTKHIKKAVTVSTGGMMVLVLLCRSEEDLRFAVSGFKLASQHAREKTRTSIINELEKELEALSDVCAKEFENSMKCLHYFHHLYRPHHHHNHPPLRFHNGILAEVLYDPSYEIVTYDPKSKRTMNRMKMPSEQFQRGMYLRARITGYDKDDETYELDYVDGPYYGNREPNAEDYFKLPEGSRKNFKFQLTGVKDTYLVVDLENTYSTHLPLVIVLITVLQITFFIQYVVDHPEQDLTIRGPIAGTDEWLFKIITSYPSCNDIRGEVYRIISHQFVFNGYISIIYNIILQLVFGLPLNMVHGQTKFFMLYEMGVIAGVLCFVSIGGGHGQLLGSSGGVYSIIGMHLAEILINWDLDSKGIMNHWTRLVILATFIGIDLVIYNFTQSDVTSFTAHGGGMVMGIVLGIVLLDNPEVGW
eukprot:CAMPEP_0114378790 /NCGR_PEP_ID=MMETSP0102-20121206/1847_1 /TAXON_ID=38822 ORGANISM="Pteridomonas danica, Strain PT" /NCGR_SAMPLE_ID=MMETSP0102 /ASSEMBLY_ACC=CAM_ASM_000212 /LENGTH=756 /DNA_ID=CAMNT_0001533715 /DNA_START=22 /DNA_END=2289 /DNA_ORIENTATION=-